MAFEKYYDSQKPSTEAPCIHFRNKSMYVTGQLTVPDHPDESGTTHCWCNITQHVLGPDHLTVLRNDCTAGRDCYKSTH